MDAPARMTPKQAAEYACVSLSLIYGLLKARKIPATRVGLRGRGKWIISREELDGFLAGCKLGDLPHPVERLNHLKQP